MSKEKIYTRKSTGIDYKIIHETLEEYCFFRVEGIGFIIINKSLLNKEFKIK